MPDGILLTLEDVAHKLRISYNQTRKLVLFQKAIPYVKVGARGIRVRETDLENYIAKLEKVGEEKATESQGDIREPYVGRQILSKKEGK